MGCKSLGHGFDSLLLATGSYVGQLFNQPFTHSTLLESEAGQIGWKLVRKFDVNLVIHKTQTMLEYISL